MAELIKRRAAAPAKDAARTGRPEIIKLAEPYSLSCLPCGTTGCETRGGNGRRKRRSGTCLPA